MQRYSCRRKAQGVYVAGHTSQVPAQLKYPKVRKRATSQQATGKRSADRPQKGQRSLGASERIPCLARDKEDAHSHLTETPDFSQLSGL